MIFVFSVGGGNLEKEISVNIVNSLQFAKEIGARMAKRKKGSIIQTASIYSSSMASDQRIYKGSRYLNKKIKWKLMR